MSLPAPLQALAAAWPFDDRQPAAIVTEGILDLSALVGAAGWARLPMELRRRFAAGHAPVTYGGTMDLHCSAVGAVLAALAAPFGHPLPGRRRLAVPTEVRVSARDGGVVWERRFASADGASAHRVRSMKLAGPDGTLLERTDGGLGMVLDVIEGDGALIFRSRSYFLAIGRWRVPVPMLLTPGRCTVSHRAEGARQFRFTLEMIHPLWGRTFLQTGIFTDPEEIRS